ncbi:unnamed protein product [Ectocarpus fasciculatus]
MYNGIGLQTVRGSATSGHVQKNMSHIKPEFFRNKLEANVNTNRHGMGDDRGRRSKANPEILEHIRKREVEAKIYAARDELENMGYTEEEINERLTELRAEITRSNKAIVSTAKDSHSILTRKDTENEKAKQAFGITGDFRAGDSFNPEVQEQRRQARMKEREDKEIAWQKRKAEEAERRESQKVRRAELDKEREEARQRRAARSHSRSRSRSRGRYRRDRRYDYRSRDTASDAKDRWALHDGRDRRGGRRRSPSLSYSRSRSRSRGRTDSRRRGRSYSRSSRSSSRSRGRADSRRRGRSYSRSSRSSSRSESRSSSGSRSRSRSPSRSMDRRSVPAARATADDMIDDRVAPNPSRSQPPSSSLEPTKESGSRSPSARKRERSPSSASSSSSSSRTSRSSSSSGSSRSSSRSRSRSRSPSISDRRDEKKRRRN